MNRKLTEDPSWLDKMHNDNLLTTREMAELAECSQWTITARMKKFGIVCRSQAESLKLRWNNDEVAQQRLSDSMTRLWADEDFRHRMEISRKDVWTDELRNKLSETHKRLAADPAVVDRLSKIAKKVWADPELRSYMSELMTGEGNPQWQGGISYEPYTEDFSETFKEHIRSLQDYRCFICGKKTRGKRKLDVHHIDYDKTNSTDENCVALCRKCHAKTSHNRDEWKLWFINELANVEIIYES